MPLFLTPSLRCKLAYYTAIFRLAAKSRFQHSRKLKFPAMLKSKEQNDYDNVRREPKIYFFMSNKIIKDEAKLFDALLGKFDFPKDVDFYLYVYKKSRRLNKYWSPDYNKFFFDIIDMHYEDLYLILKCKNDTFEVLEREECLFKD